jgi:hypothetical protein
MLRCGTNAALLGEVDRGGGSARLPAFAGMTDCFDFAFEFVTPAKAVGHLYGA